MVTVSVTATINDYLLNLAPDGTLVLKELAHDDGAHAITLTPLQAATLYAFFQRPDVSNRLEGPPAD